MITLNLTATTTGTESRHDISTKAFSFAFGKFDKAVLFSGSIDNARRTGGVERGTYDGFYQGSMGGLFERFFTYFLYIYIYHCGDFQQVFNILVYDIYIQYLLRSPTMQVTSLSCLQLSIHGHSFTWRVTLTQKASFNEKRRAPAPVLQHQYKRIK